MPPHNSGGKCNSSHNYYQAFSALLCFRFQMVLGLRTPDDLEESGTLLENLARLPWTTLNFATVAELASSRPPVALFCLMNIGDRRNI